MKIWSELPEDRSQPGGFLYVVSGGKIVFGPVECFGEADNQAAIRAGNPSESPEHAYGDHPYGLCRVMGVREIDQSDPAAKRSFGPAFLPLDPMRGQALQAEESGRTGLGIHGGDPAPDGSLRVTHGCLRVKNKDIAQIAKLFRAETKRSPDSVIFYECRPLGGSPIKEFQTEPEEA